MLSLYTILTILMLILSLRIALRAPRTSRLTPLTTRRKARNETRKEIVMNTRRSTLLGLLTLLFFCLLPHASRAQGQDPSGRTSGYYFTNGNPYYNAGYNGQCTWYVWGRCAETGWNIGFTGNAIDYYGNVQNAGGRDMSPGVGAIQCLALTQYGHVAYVVQVNDYNSWVVEEYNVISLQWDRETVSRDPNNPSRVHGDRLNWTTLQGFIHPRGGSSVGTDGAAYVADVTVPDNTTLYTNQSFVKTWRMKNTGNTTWGGGYQWVFDKGTQMNGASPSGVPGVGPGGTGDISVGMQAPGTPGTYQGFWRLRGPSGEFGQQVWVLIKVVSPPPPPVTTPPSVTFDETNKNRWFGPAGLNTPLAPWTLHDQGGGIGGFSQSWDHDDDANLGTSAQFPGSASGYMEFAYLNASTREGQHTVYVRAWNRDRTRYADYPSGWYGYDATPPAVALTSTQTAGATYTASQHLTFHISEPLSGLAKWGAAWDADPGAQTAVGDGGALDLPTGTHTLHVHAWDTVGNNQDWTFGPFTLSPAPPTFALSATAPATVAAGAMASISATVLDTGGATGGDIVDVEIFNGAGAQVAQQFYASQNFLAGGSQTYSPAWTASTTPGAYTVKLGVFTGDWTKELAWNDNAATINVINASAAPAFTATASASPTNVAPGGTTNIQAIVTDSGGASVNLVDVEIFDSTGKQVAQKFWDAQAFALGGTQTFAFPWTVPVATGTYTVKVGVFNPGWSGGSLYWNDRAATVTVR